LNTKKTTIDANGNPGLVLHGWDRHTNVVGVKLVNEIPDLTLLIAIYLKTIQVLISNKKHSALICSHSKGPFIITTMNDTI
jgi:hypothetical protein